jgi:hypothetical protein
VKHTLLASALVAVLVSSAAAQNNDRLPQASLDREVDLQVPAHAAVLGNPHHRAQTPPKYCKPCLFYAGDFDPNASDANGLANEFDLIISTGAAVYVPFMIPKGKTWTITGLFTSNFMDVGTLDPATSPYEIREAILKAGGNGGKLVCHGRKPATLTDTHTNGNFDMLIYATKVEHIKGCRLPPGRYWMSVVPYCTNPNDSTCTNTWRSYLANDDGAMANRFGLLEPANDSFFNSVYFGANWQPSSEQQSSMRFVVGVEGTAK